MFKLALKRMVWWPVAIQIPQDGGKTLAAECDVQYEILEQKEHDELVTSGADLLKRVLHGWKRVKAEDGEGDVEFNPETKDAMLAIPYVRVAFVKGYYEASQGRKAERKN